jgi:NAD(P) transhydrogenase subunit beta
VSGIVILDVAYIIAAFLLLFGLARLARPATAVQGFNIAVAGMGVAVIATLISVATDTAWTRLWPIPVGIALGLAVAVPIAIRVNAAKAADAVSVLNGLGGGAVALIALFEFRHEVGGGLGGLMLADVILGLASAVVGTVSLSGSAVAAGKLREVLPRDPVTLGRFQPLVVGGLSVVVGISAIVSVAAHSELAFVFGVLLAAGVLGVLAVLAIGAGNMAIVVSLLNSFTGMSLAAAGLLQGNLEMIVVGPVVGASGLILTSQMAAGMGRSLVEIFGVMVFPAEVTAAGGTGAADRTARRVGVQDAGALLAYARRVVFVPGFGMGAAGAQHELAALGDALRNRGVEVEYAVHPVAGRMPGHMNSLLLEARVPYEQLRQMEQINHTFKTVDVALVVGANDTVNPAARTRRGSPIYGMPVLEVTNARDVIVMKRSLDNPGFSGVDNDLFYEPKTAMLLGDLREKLRELATEVGKA